MSKLPPHIVSLFEGDQDKDYEAFSLDESRNILALMLAERRDGPRLATPGVLSQRLAENSPLPFNVAVLLKRLEVNAPELEFSEWVILLASLMCDRPGVAVMWAHALYRITKESSSVSLGDLIMATPLGIGKPTNAFLRRIWDGQKRQNQRVPGSDNWLDYPEAWA